MTHFPDNLEKLSAVDRAFELMLDHHERCGDLTDGCPLRVVSDSRLNDADLSSAKAWLWRCRGRCEAWLIRRNLDPGAWLAAGGEFDANRAHDGRVVALDHAMAHQ
jgi:hypothetical protein